MKAIGKLKQWTGERIAGSSKTDVSEDFKQLQADTEQRKDATEALNEAANLYIKTLGKRKESKISKEKKLPLEILAESMGQYGDMLDQDSGYGKALREFGSLTSKISISQNEYVGKIRDGYGASLNHAMIEIKDYSVLKKKLESRRLDFDAKLNKVHKSKKEKPELEEDVRVAQMKYEDSLTDVTNKMIALNSEEDEQLDDLLSFVDAQLEYYSKCSDLTRALQDRLKCFPRNGPTERHQHRQSSSNRASSIESNLPARSRQSTTSTLNDYGRIDDRSSKNNARDSDRNLNNASTRTSGYEESKRNTGGDYEESSRRSNINISSSASNLNSLAAADNGRDKQLKYAAQAGAMVYPSEDGGSYSSGNASAPAAKQKALKRVKVLFDFKAEGLEELSIHAGDILTVVAEIDAGWWEGIDASTGKRGMFPSNYVEILQSTEDSNHSRRSTANVDAGGQQQQRDGHRSQHITSNIASTYISPPNHPKTLKVAGAMMGGAAATATTCGSCGCREYKANAFKADQCVNCFHKH